MKKITFILSLLITSISFSQEFPLDFEDAADNAWGVFNGAASSVIDDGSGTNNVFQLVSNGADFDGTFLALAVAVDLSDASNNTISLTVDPQDALGAAEERTHLLKFEGGVGGPVVAELYFNTVGPDEQTVLVNFPAGLGTFATIVIFADSGVGNTALGTYWFDDITVVADPAATCTDGIQNGTETGVDCGGTCPNVCPQPPTTIVAAPARPLLDVLSVFGPAYLDVPPSGVQQFGGATFVNYTAVTTDDARELTTPSPGDGAQYQYFFGTDTGLDLTNFTTVHLDSWVLDAGAADSVIRIILQQFDPVSGAFQHNLEATIDVNTPGVETWNTVDIDLASFSNPTLAKNNIQQIQIVAQGAAFGPTYLTNFYFHKGTVLGADDFSINDLKVSPNPSNDVWNIESSNISIDTIEIYDLLGKRVLNLSPNSQQVTIDASNLGTGIYLAKLYSNGATKTIKLVKN